MNDMRAIIDLIENSNVQIQAFPFPYLYHVTRESNLESILRDGLKTSHYGSVHGEMDIHPPEPAIYLSRRAKSNNLHSDLFDGSKLVILKITTQHLDPTEAWPDDAIYSMFSDEYVFANASQVAAAFGIDRLQGKEMLSRLENASDADLPLMLKPVWNWYLKWRPGGEIAYTKDIPASAIVSRIEY